MTNSQFNVICGYLANADRVRIQGVQIDLAMRPSDRWNTYVSGAFTDHQ